MLFIKKLYHCTPSLVTDFCNINNQYIVKMAHLECIWAKLYFSFFIYWCVINPFGEECLCHSTHLNWSSSCLRNVDMFAVAVVYSSLRLFKMSRKKLLKFVFQVAPSFYQIVGYDLMMVIWLTCAIGLPRACLVMVKTDFTNTVGTTNVYSWERN